jgi:anti-sigma-K factor RskA
MDNEHSVFRENIPAFALGALDADESAALEAHLLTCDSCRRELAEFREVSEHLMAALPPRQPSSEVKTRLRGQLPSARKSPQRRIAWTFGRFAMGAVLALLLALNILSFLQVRSLQRQQAALLRQVRNDQAALAMLSYPETQSLPIQAEQFAGRLLLNREQNTVMLITWNLPPLPENQTYQAWLIDPSGDRVSGGTFRPASSSSYNAAPIWPEESLSAYTGLGVTVEPAGGSLQPTGERVFKVDF